MLTERIFSLSYVIYLRIVRFRGLRTARFLVDGRFLQYFAAIDLKSAQKLLNAELLFVAFFLRIDGRLRFTEDDLRAGALRRLPFLASKSIVSL